MSEDLEDELGARSSMDRKMAELRGEVGRPAGSGRAVGVGARGPASISLKEVCSLRGASHPWGGYPSVPWALSLPYRDQSTLTSCTW